MSYEAFLIGFAGFLGAFQGMSDEALLALGAFWGLFNACRMRLFSEACWLSGGFPRYVV